MIMPDAQISTFILLNPNIVATGQPWKASAFLIKLPILAYGGVTV